MIAYGKQSINKDDIEAVVKVLESNYLTTGPNVLEFENEFSKKVNSKYSVAVSNGTAALHLACLSLGIKEGDEVISTPITFVASSNSVLYCGAKPVLVDVDENGLIDADLIEEKITSKTKAIIVVHYSGLVCDMKKIKQIAQKYDLKIIEDSCHALGGEYYDSKVGSCEYGDIATFSFHPVKHITSGEGGMITTNDEEIYKKLLLLRTHGITKNTDDFENNIDDPWYYEMQELGFNYRITDFQCALGLSQLKRLDLFVNKRREIAQKYNIAFKNNTNIETLFCDEHTYNSYHLYVIKVENSLIRRKLFDYLKGCNIFCQVHYIPLHYQPYYQNLGYKKGDFPKAEEFYDKILSLPMYYDLKEEEQDLVIQKIEEFFNKNE